MAQDSLTSAKKMMKHRKFSRAILLLESREENYTDNFDYYLQLGICYLYTGNYGSASSNFQKARKIRMTDVNLLLGQAVLFLRRGDTEKAIQYYMEILELDPQNKIASDAMEFIRKDGDYSTICRWVDTGRIEQFFPQLGVSPYKIAGILIPVLAACLGVFLVVKFSPGQVEVYSGRANLADLQLTQDEKKNLQETDMSSGVYKYILSASEIEESYEAAQHYYNLKRDNAAQVEINRLLNSNASLSVKQKANRLKEYLEVPEFGNIEDVPTYAQVLEDKDLYLDCWVQWGGRVAVIEENENYSLYDFLIGYQDLKKLEGRIQLRFDAKPDIHVESPLEVLAKISSDDGKIYLEGRAVYQSVKNSLVTAEKN